MRAEGVWYKYRVLFRLWTTKNGLRRPIYRLRIFQENSRFWVELFCPTEPNFLSDFDDLGPVLTLIYFFPRYKWSWLQNLVLGGQIPQESAPVECFFKMYIRMYTTRYVVRVKDISYLMTWKFRNFTQIRLIFPSPPDLGSWLGPLVDLRSRSKEIEVVDSVYIHVSGTKNENPQIGKQPYHDHEHFLVHRTQFSTNSVTWGLDLRLRDLIRPFSVIKDRVSWPKITSVEDLRAKDRSWVLISKVLVGTPWTKIGLKTAEKHSQLAQKVFNANIESSCDSERPKMGSGDPFVDLGCFTKTQDFGLKYFVPQSPSFVRFRRSVVKIFGTNGTVYWTTNCFDSKTWYLGGISGGQIPPESTRL